MQLNHQSTITRVHLLLLDECHSAAPLCVCVCVSDPFKITRVRTQLVYEPQMQERHSKKVTQRCLPSGKVLDQLSLILESIGLPARKVMSMTVGGVEED